MLTQDFTQNNREIDRYLGSEFDLILNYSINKEITLQSGYCAFFNSGSTKNYFKMGGVDTYPSQWAYLMLTIKPNLYKTPVDTKN
ncbi:MAG: hypothetical protein HC831_31960 [Chloroflexia bacterium]|nr:hypothetical protein [Chloroflexia bacterium]